MKRDKSISEKEKSDELIVTGAFYEISSGIVDFRTLESDLVFKASGPGWLDRLVELVEPARFLGIMTVDVVL